MRSSSNPYIFFDNDDPSDFEFTYISFSKWIIKKFLRKITIYFQVLWTEKKYLKKIFRYFF